MKIRNIAIIAHVDHGKTTLVDALLKQSETKMQKDSADALIMDSNELERERGITIFSKNASVIYQDTKINIIDTPGHADFGGEVERVLKMADGALLLIDAKEGPMPQTRFVLKKALDLGLKIIVVVNKIDRPDARIDYVLDKTLDLFIDLGADDNVADFPIIYASAKEGKAGEETDLTQMTGIAPIFDNILRHIPAPKVDPDATLQILITTLGRDAHKGRIAIGRIANGRITAGQEISRIARDGSVSTFRLTGLTTFVGLDKVEIDRAEAGDIVAVSGITEPLIGETISEKDNPQPLPVLSIEEPTINAIFQVNSSPFAGREGEFKTARQIEERLIKELETDMALKVENITSGWLVSGRGELHLAILIERMRREGYEFQVGKPKVIEQMVEGRMLTPFEKVFIEVPEEHSGVVMQKMTSRRAELIDMRTEDGITKLEFITTTKAFFGYRSEFVTDTRGMGILNTLFYKYDTDPGFAPQRSHGSIIAFETGSTTAYALATAQDRGQLFVGAGTDVYKGQVVGQNSRIEDISVNVCKGKNLTNMRSKGEGVSEYIKTPRTMGLEDALEYIADDELVEVTPKSVRIRKIILDEKEAKRLKSQGK